MLFRAQTLCWLLLAFGSIAVAQQPAALFADQCASCHSIGGGDGAGPDLKGVGERRQAVPPAWEFRSDWEIFRAIAKKFSELAAVHLPDPVRDVIATPLSHDSPAELAQPALRDWTRGECEPLPGKTMPALKLVQRDNKNLYRQFISFGPAAAQNGLSAHGTQYGIRDEYEDAVANGPAVSWGGASYPSLLEDEHVCDLILRLATVHASRASHRDA